MMDEQTQALLSERDSCGQRNDSHVQRTVLSYLKAVQFRKLHIYPCFLSFQIPHNNRHKIHDHIMEH